MIQPCSLFLPLWYVLTHIVLRQGGIQRTFWSHPPVHGQCGGHSSPPPSPLRSAEARRHPKDVLALLIYLTSWKDMGSAEVTCEGGCSCTPSTVHGLAK